MASKARPQESSDHKSQTFDALVVDLRNPTAQAHVEDIAATANATPNGETTTKTNQVLHDVDGDGFQENTQWIAGKDDSGNAQGMLVLDHNNNGLIETADILHLGGSGGDNQRNSLAWLDSNGDGKLRRQRPRVCRHQTLGR